MLLSSLALQQLRKLTGAAWLISHANSLLAIDMAHPVGVAWRATIELELVVPMTFRRQDVDGVVIVTTPRPTVGNPEAIWHRLERDLHVAVADQYSSANMIVMTRTVTLASAGSGEPYFTSVSK